jgi:hypothetical protein
MKKSNYKLKRNTAEFANEKGPFLVKATTAVEGEIMFEFPLVKVRALWYNNGYKIAQGNDL